MRIQYGFPPWPALLGLEGSLPYGSLLELELSFELQALLMSMSLGADPLFAASLRSMLLRPISMMAAFSGMGPSELRELLESDPSLALDALAPHERHNLQQAVARSLRSRCTNQNERPTPAAPATPTPATPATQTAPSSGTVDPQARPCGGVRAEIVKQALADNGKISDNVYDGREYEGWQHLQDVIDKAQTGPIGDDGKHHPPGYRLPDDAVRTHPRPVWKDAQGNVHHIDWCGIWATRMYQQAGVNCYWKSGEGLKGDVQKIYSPKKEDVKVGDIIVGPGPNWHHAIVTDIVKNDKGEVVSFKTMNGNHPGIAPGEMQASSVCALYRPKDQEAKEPKEPKPSPQTGPGSQSSSPGS